MAEAVTVVVAPPNTPIGTHVDVTPADSTGARPVTVQFDDVTAAGKTSLATSSTGPPPPAGFSVGSTYYDVTTTATFDGHVTVCVSYAGVMFPDPPYIRLLHYDGTAWVDVTTAITALISSSAA